MRARLLCRAVGLSGTLLLAFPAPGQLQPMNPQVVDATGRVLGPLIGGDGQYALVAFGAKGITFALRVRGNTYSCPIQSLFFASPDCSGTPYVSEQPGNSAFAPCAVVAPGRSVFAADPAVPAETIVARSSLGELACESFSPYMATGVPAVFVIQLDAEFVPPISVRHAP